VRVAGGGARSPLWNQIRADALQMNVEIVEQSNVATLGAAMLAAIGAGLYADLKDAGTMIRIETTLRPNTALQDHYAHLYAHYRALHEAVKPPMRA
jgi:xylulokinase